MKNNLWKKISISLLLFLVIPVSAFADCEMGHTVVNDENVDATCTQPGHLLGSHCGICNEVLTAQVEMPALGHSMHVDITYPTCLEQGYTTNYCGRCDYSYVDSYTEPTGHNMLFGKTVVYPTCTESGLERYDCWYCDYYEERETEAKGHTEITDYAVNPTCTSTGLTAGSWCFYCEEKLSGETVIPATGHKEITVGVVKPTENKAGYTGDVTCYVCNTVIKTGEIILPAIKLDETEIPAVVDIFLELSDKSSKFYYHIPQIILKDNLAEEANAEIYSELVKYYEEDAEYVTLDFMSAIYGKLTYGVGQKNEVVSLFVATGYPAMDIYKAYNVSAETGKAVDDEYVLSLYGYEKNDAYYDLVKEKLEKFYKEQNEEHYRTADKDMLEWLNEQLEWTITDKNVGNTVPFINDEGELCVIAYIGAIAGADAYPNVVNITSNAEVNKPEFAKEKIPNIKINEYTPDVDKPELPEEYTVGDVDRDGTVTAKDATQILRYINGKSSVFTANDADTLLIEKIADVDGDGSVTAKDATQILRHINGKTSVLNK